MSGGELMDRHCKKCGARLSIFMGEKFWNEYICQNCEALKPVLEANSWLCATDFM